ncbi:DUF2309 domain-containing protein [Thiohalomonas denitrificans]|uniref:Probable inorganic carbon transporter subunit DabA n=1 Tax=Thiohalomonas denitrificans TaxID=415747 RepID=A0A1G5QYR9_9GAMM|nr:DUF2309 domain-containing protein [Thiohalomonas denitrificans]SCZ66985.1 hypothetical protein SAMN03097708_03058 [Thiohalomonas denitrificans]
MSGSTASHRQPGDNPTADMHTRLEALIAHLEHVLPAQAPIREFVHHNTLHGFAHLRFREALSEARQLTGARGYLPNETFRELYRSGRITRADLEAVIAEASAGEAELGAEAVLIECAAGPVRRRDVLIAGLLYPFRPVTACQLNWQIEELNAFTTCQPDLAPESRDRLLAAARAHGIDGESATVKDLWAACLETFGLTHASIHPEELVDISPEQAEAMATGLDEEETAGEGARIDRLVRKEAARRLETHFDSVGRETTLRGLLLALTGEDLMEELLPPLVRQLSAHLDQGLAGWHNPKQGEGFYAAWRASARRDYSWIFRDRPEWRLQLERLPEDPTNLIVQELRLLGLPEARWESYLEQLALELPGWSGMFLWRHRHPGYEGHDAPVEMVDYLAVRLVMERMFAQRLCRHHWRIEASLPMLRWYFRRHPAELSVRHFLFNARLPEYLTTLAQRLVTESQHETVENSDDAWRRAAHLIWIWRQSPAADRPVGRSVFRSAWPLFRLAQHLGVCGAELRSAGADAAAMLLDSLDYLTEERSGWLWLTAYERHYREQIFAALVANHDRGPLAERQQLPEAQLVFCIDDREEGTRRHLEEINPALETLGAAGFFGVPINWRGLDDVTVSPLCPVVITPTHEVQERPAGNADREWRRHKGRREQRLRWKNRLFQGTRLGVLQPAMLSAAAGFAAPLVLIGKVLLPARFTAWVEGLRRDFDGVVPTDLTLTADADSPPPTTERPRLGFTDDEQAERVAGFLRAIGLTDRFSPLVVLMGHGSHSQNNPHRAAYDCGACSGRHGGPNARVFAAMANRPTVRERLAAGGIEVPADTHFIGAEHDTCDDRIEWYDEAQLPPALQPALEKLQGELTEAGQRHARERSRRFASAPAKLSEQRAWRHVAGRAADFSQARPELGHATNASAFVGRRSMSRGAFFDRRAFLISYDPTRDPEEKILEATLLSAGPVGAGISLEYYFSTVDNENYGCGTKVVHNVTGLLGVMEGAGSDLRTGLPRQMIEIHEAMRLLIVVEAKTDTLTRIYQRQPPLQELVGKGWVRLAAKDPDAPLVHLFEPERGWVEWQGQADGLPQVEGSADWFEGHHDALPPALITRASRDEVSR